MKNFSQYAQERSTQESQETSKATTQDTFSAEELTQKIAQSYNGKSNTDIFQKILTEAEKSKRAGTLSDEEIEQFYQNFSPMLNGFQRKKLREIVDELKRI